MYLYEAKNKFVLGAIADLDIGKSHGSAPFNSTYDLDISNNTKASLRAILGYAGIYDGLLPYISAGVAMEKTNITLDAAGTTKANPIVMGWEFGLGAIYELKQFGYENTNIYAEWNKFTSGSQGFPIAAGLGLPVNAKGSEFKIGLNFRM